ncbi:unnamed protein product [Adineta ricciae]|uniref:ATP-grasp domain-containing protein n=1 Tax=Adineta ricciae TaxID=249248 RepID=A0A815T775_ADIRI|nr:unnamed protein product [Adineta ricciae]CAF1537759.1 unnamed protein product [Adineta ricciae]
MSEENSSTIINDSSGETKRRTNPRKRSVRKRRSLYIEPKPVCFIGQGNNAELIEDILKSIGYENRPDKVDEFKFRWVQCSYEVNWNLFKDGEQIVNHIQGEDYFTNKLQLYQSLQTYENTSQTIIKRPSTYLSLNEYLPQTFKLDEKHDRDILFNLHKPGDVWICKPSCLNQGKGIYIVRDISSLKDKYDQLEANPRSRSSTFRQQNKTIVQRYIMNPLLIHGKKFDIRCYMLISSVQPLLVHYHSGYIRLSMFDFDQHDENLLTHLTNQYMQKKDPKYYEMKEDTAWTMEQFNDYMNKYILPKKNLPPNWVLEVLPKQIERIMLNVIESIRMRLKRRIGCFGLYGYDFMIDNDLKVLLIEINVNPALSTNTNTLVQAIPPVVKESILISIECFEKIHHAEKIFPLKSLQTFQCIYNELERKSSLPLIRQKRQLSPSKATNTNTDDKVLREKTNFFYSVDRVQSNQQENELLSTLHRSLTNSQLMRTSKSVNDIHQAQIQRRPLTRPKSIRSRSKSSNRIKSNEPVQTS